jgi:hypothetical protein
MKDERLMPMLAASLSAGVQTPHERKETLR